MGKHSKRKRPGRMPGREQKKLAPSWITVLTLVSELIGLVTVIVELVNAMLHTGR
ncbi:hypothetical protein [Corynebacterium lizhenjunii]|uniref:hypothetical protein n=1 Tax=Corynebacterium lizhenjunii TaxID=2709394 RepID=UPI0013EC3904|nr:hypothetical protein [Corynebacterium lizhenjunii]